VDHVEVDGLDIAYERAGSGPPVLLLHGYVGDGPSTWRHQIDDLCGDFTVVAWDAPGAGASSDPPESFGITGYADCLASFVHAIGFDRAHIIGLSFGGALALGLYGGHPDVVASLVLASAYAGWRGSLEAELAEARLAQALRLAELSPAEFVATLLPTMFLSSVPPVDVAAFRSAMEAFHPAGFRALARASADDLRHIPPTVAVPTLLVYGDGDERAPRSVAERLRQDIAPSRLVMLEGVGHVCNLEAPDRFNDAVRSFLAANAT